MRTPRFRARAAVCTAIATLASCGLVRRGETGRRRTRAPGRHQPWERGEARARPAARGARFRTHQRLDEHGVIPHNAVMNAKARLDQMREAGAGDGWNPSPQSVWTWLGPGNIGGRIRAIVIHPTTPTTMWLGSVGGGDLEDDQRRQRVGAARRLPPDALDRLHDHRPAQPQHALRGHRRGLLRDGRGLVEHRRDARAGIFRTTDGGTTWTHMPSTSTPDWYFVEPSGDAPDRQQHPAGRDGHGHLPQHRRGRRPGRAPRPASTTTSSSTPPTGNASSPASTTARPATPPTAASPGPPRPAPTGTAIELRYAPRRTPTMVYAAAASGGSIRVYRSTDGGVTYTLRPPAPGIPTYEAYNIALWVDPTNADFIILGGV